jgi:hypothetical protein
MWAGGIAIALVVASVPAAGQDDAKAVADGENEVVAPDARGMFNEMDKDGSGVISADEFIASEKFFKHIDQDENGTLTLAEFNAMWKREGARKDDAPKVGDVAPTFTLSRLDGTEKFDLAEFKGDKPVLLLFGSYT